MLPEKPVSTQDDQMSYAVLAPPLSKLEHPARFTFSIVIPPQMTNFLAIDPHMLGTLLPRPRPGNPVTLVNPLTSH